MRLWDQNLTPSSRLETPFLCSEAKSELPSSRSAGVDADLKVADGVSSWWAGTNNRNQEIRRNQKSEIRRKMAALKF